MAELRVEMSPFFNLSSVKRNNFFFQGKRNKNCRGELSSDNISLLRVHGSTLLPDTPVPHPIDHSRWAGRPSDPERPRRCLFPGFWDEDSGIANQSGGCDFSKLTIWNMVRHNYIKIHLPCGRKRRHRHRGEGTVAMEG